MRRRGLNLWLSMLGVVWGSAVSAQTTPTFRAAKLFNLPGSVSDATGLGALADVGSSSGGPDGKLDLLTASQAQQINVLFGRGDGTFTSGPNTDISLIPTAMAVADMNNDQAIDVILAENGGTVSIWKGKNDGTFEIAGSPLDVGLVARGLAVVDVNRDGKLDVVAAGDSNQQAGVMRVLFGNNDASLTPSLETINTGFGTSAIAAADFNADNKVDVAVANEISNDVGVFRGDGSGGFTQVQTVAVGDSPIALVTQDCNGDQRPDLLAANSNSDNVAVLDARAGGTFASARFYVSGSSASTPRGLAMGDVDGDGKADAVVVNNFSFDAGVLYGDGACHFSAPRLFVVDAEPVGVTVGDLNGDGHADVVGLTRGGGNSPTAGVLLSLLDRALNGVENLIIDVNPTQVVVADLNNDALPDVIVSQNGSGSAPGTARILRATSGGAFVDPQVLTSNGDAAAVASGDFNGDGRFDVAIVNRSTSNVSIFLTDPDGRITTKRAFPIGSGVNAVAVGDWNRDGRSDLALALQGNGQNGMVQILIADPSGGFGAPANLPVGQLPVGIDSGDFNQDGRLDLVTANNGSNNISVMLGNGNGSFQASTSVGVAGGPRSVAVADFDRDGLDDVAVSLSLTPSVLALYGDGTGRFPTAGRPLSLGSGDIPSSVAARDLNGDGNPDLVVAAEVSSTVKVFLRSAAPNVRAFQTGDTLGVNRRPISVVTGDFDGDGRYDAAVAASSPAPTTSVLTNIRSNVFLRGDGNGDGETSAADAVAVMRKMLDGTGIRVEDVARGSYAAAPGVDANGDGSVTLPDVLAVSSLVFNPQFLGM